MIYNWRKNFTAIFNTQEKTIRAKLAFKTKETDWLNTEEPVIALVSIQSSFHSDIDGDLKMNAFISTIKDHVKGPVTVLLSDFAHLQVSSLKFQNNTTLAMDECLRSAQFLSQRYQSYFGTCKVAYWHSYIWEDATFPSSLRWVEGLYESDFAFRKHVMQDAESTYTAKRANEFSNKSLFIERTIADILGQTACVLVLANKGYRFQFYPGTPYQAISFLNQTNNPAMPQISWIDVFLTIEKKSMVPSRPLLEFP